MTFQATPEMGPQQEKYIEVSQFRDSFKAMIIQQDEMPDVSLIADPLTTEGILPSREWLTLLMGHPGLARQHIW